MLVYCIIASNTISSKHTLYIDRIYIYLTSQFVLELEGEENEGNLSTFFFSYNVVPLDLLAFVGHYFLRV